MTSTIMVGVGLTITVMISRRLKRNQRSKKFLTLLSMNGCSKRNFRDLRLVLCNCVFIASEWTRCVGVVRY